MVMDIRQSLGRQGDRHDRHHPAIFVREDMAMHHEDTAKIDKPGAHLEVPADDDGFAIRPVEPGRRPPRGVCKDVPPDALPRLGIIAGFPRLLIHWIDVALPRQQLRRRVEDVLVYRIRRAGGRDTHIWVEDLGYLERVDMDMKWVVDWLKRRIIDDRPLLGRVKLVDLYPFVPIGLA